MLRKSQTDHGKTLRSRKNRYGETCTEIKKKLFPMSWCTVFPTVVNVSVVKDMEFLQVWEKKVSEKGCNVGDLLQETAAIDKWIYIKMTDRIG